MATSGALSNEKKLLFLRRYSDFKRDKQQPKRVAAFASKDSLELKTTSSTNVFSGRKECLADMDCSSCLADPTSECAAKHGYVQQTVYSASAINFVSV